MTRYEQMILFYYILIVVITSGGHITATKIVDIPVDTV